MTSNQENDITGILGVAVMCAEHILKRWYEDIEEAVSDGEQYNEYTNILLPQAKMDAEKIALTLVGLFKVDFDDLSKNTSIKS